jgi:EAL domain-containing protein (putative c-di-GMP-specific phosphodiesterase class I)
MIESDPLMLEVGSWTLAAALEQMERWRQDGLVLKVSVNVAAIEMQMSGFVERLQAALARHPSLAPACLQLEVVETSALENLRQVSQVMQDCLAIGVSFAIDDFGTGYSSLADLKGLPAQELKIDQSFVRDMLHDDADLAILRGVIGLAEAFGKQVIAEGVESEAHCAALVALGCELAQGYGIARPMPAQALPAWIDEYHARVDETVPQ